MPTGSLLRTASLALLFAVARSLPSAAAEEEARAAAEVSDVRRLLSAYPDALARIDGNWLVWRDGTRMPLDDGRGAKPFADWLAGPDIEDMLRLPYPAGAGAFAPPPESDPGRARNALFFARMYGDCRKGEVRPRLKTVVWLPGKARQRLEVTAVNGVAERLAAVSAELDRLPAAFDKYLAPAAGTYNCRVIAGTDRVSAHGYGIAVDIAVAESDYWRWSGRRGSGEAARPAPYRNRIPLEIVHVFERHGFIWGGRWHHFDTMHFEYRPELLPALAPLDAAPTPPAAATPATASPEPR